MTHRTLPLLLLVAVVLASPPTLAHGGGHGDAKTVLLTIHTRPVDGGNVSFFTANGEPVANPTLNVTAGRTLVIFVYNDGDANRTLHVGAPAEKATDVLRPGGQGDLWFHAPNASTVLPYWAEPAREGELEGEIHVVSVGDDERSTPAPAWVAVLGMVGAALVLQHRP